MHKLIYMLTNNLDKRPLDPSHMDKHRLSLTHTHTHNLLSKVTLVPLLQSPSGFINPVIYVCLFRTWSLPTQRSSTSCTPETRLDASLPQGTVPPGSEWTCCFIFSPPPSAAANVHSSESQKAFRSRSPRFGPQWPDHRGFKVKTRLKVIKARSALCTGVCPSWCPDEGSTRRLWSFRLNQTHSAPSIILNHANAWEQTIWS